MNENIKKKLLTYANFEYINKNHFKYNAYMKAIKIIDKLNYQITKENVDDLLKIKGIGKSIKEKIKDYLYQQINLVEAKINAITELSSVFGIGINAANQLYNLGITNISQLKNNKDLLTHQQLIGLKYYNDFSKKIPRNEILKISKLLFKNIKKINSEIIFTVCGSYRRQLPKSSDIDILLTHPKYIKGIDDYNNLLIQIIEYLVDKKIITDILALGKKKFMGVLKLNKKSLHRRIDIRYVEFDYFYCSLLYFTGSQEFNVKMRQFARKKGFKLNEYCICKMNKKTPEKIKCEKDIFDILQMEYIPPEKRV